MADEKQNLDPTQGPVTRDFIGDEALRGDAISSTGIQMEDGKFVSFEDLAKAEASGEDTKATTDGDTKVAPTGDLTKGDVKAAPVTAEVTKEAPAPKLDDPETWVNKAPEAEIVASLEAAGGFYADERYRAAAIEFERLGTVTPETQKATAEAFGVPEDMVAAFVDNAAKARQVDAATANAAQLADAGRVAQEVSALYSIVGGEDKWEAFSKWSEDALPLADRQAFNDAMDTNPAQAQALLRGFMVQAKAAGFGDGPRDITSEGQRKVQTGQEVQGYASQDEQLRDQADPRYQTDEAFRAKVYARIAATTGF